MLVAALLVGKVEPVTGQSTDWPVVTGNKAAHRYSPLDQIHADNVAELTVAWRFDSPDNELRAQDERLQSRRMAPGSNQSIPLKIGDRLFVSTGYGQIAAIDATTGKSLWSYNPESYQYGRPTNLGFVHRGAAYWVDSKDERRAPQLFYASPDSFLRAVDAVTGEPVGDWGDDGAVDLTKGLRREINRRKYTVSSPTTVCRDVVIVGSSISDGPTHPKAPPGDVRGFDARTGEHRWTFHSIAQPGELGNSTWEHDSWKDHGNTNVWTLMSADEELGLVYLPFGTPTNDWYGGHRPGDNLFAESLVAVDCETGERRWHFQAIHHGLWDYDLPTPPILVDINVDGKPIKAAAQPSKQGFLYVLDRATGEPVWPIEERPVPQSGVPGERTSPTQPFPTKPPPFERQGMSAEQLIDFTPELHAEAMAIMQRYHYGPLYTPPSERGTLQLPNWGGGASWPGAAFDPETGRLYLPSFTSPILMTLKKPDPGRSSFDFIGSIQTSVPGPRGLPLVKPPYSRVTAYDLNRGEIDWVTPIGNGPRSHPEVRHLGLGPLGSGGRNHVLATKTLLFVTSGRGRSQGRGGRSFDLLFSEDSQAEEVLEDPTIEAMVGDPAAIRAIDKDTGAVVWRHELQSDPNSSPITYMHRGKQYLVLGVGGGDAPAEVVAYRLP